MIRGAKKFSSIILAFILLASAFWGQLTAGISIAHASASLYVSGTDGLKVGDTLTINVMVNTGGVAANAFEGTLSYPADLFQGVRGTYAGSICSLPITTPEPTGGSATFSCGTPAGYSGTSKVATVVFTVIGAGTGSFSLSGCQVLANDGQGTDITGGCSGTSLTTMAAATPPPTAAPTAAPTPKAAVTPKATATPRATAAPKPTGTTVVAETPAAIVETPAPTAPPVATLAPTTPEASADTSTPEPATTDTTTQKRSIVQAVKDAFASLKDIKKLTGDMTGVIAIILALIPALALALGIIFLIYRLYMLERKRRRTLDRLFEMELSELAALEGKMDLLSQKGGKGKEEYKEEFRKTKEHILRQLRPDYAKPVEKGKEASVAEAKPAG